MADPFAPRNDPRAYDDPPVWQGASPESDPELRVVDIEPVADVAGAAEAIRDARGYSAADVPEKATGDDGVVAWIKDAEDSDTAEARANAALEVERGRDSMRTTVVAAIESVLGPLVGDAG